MKILYDGRVFQFQKAGGINRYFSEIISGLPMHWTPIVTGVKDFGENIPKHPNLRIKNLPLFRPRRLQHRFHCNYWKPGIARSVNLLHPTYYDLTCDFKLSDFKCPIITTVYDMIYARFPNQTDGADDVFRAQREFVMRADRVICISKSTERDLLEFIPEAAGKTTVIYLGSSFPIVNETNENNLFENPTFLYVGYRGGYKNFLFLLRAFAKAASVVDAIRLRVVGPAFTSEERWQMYFLGITNKVSCVIYPDEATLQQIYRESIALLYPSRYEGFGIPPLEAMSCGTIAVTGNTTSLPEVVGKGGFMLDPTDENAWAECIIKFSSPFSARLEMLKQGFHQVKQFTWSKCIQLHIEIYKKLS